LNASKISKYAQPKTYVKDDVIVARTTSI